MKLFLRHYLRIDARGLGLFRISLGLTLLADLAYRFEHRVAFYSNEGLLPNHNHLFNLKNEGRFVWSFLHAFASAGEATVGLLLIAFFYLGFTLGFKTRVFHILSFVGLISLSARNLLTVGPGEPVALALLFVTAFLPLGSALSLDAFRSRAAHLLETKPKDLLSDEWLVSAEVVQGEHRPGWSPLSLAALGTFGVIALILLSEARARTGAWIDGTALSKAMKVHLIASPLGFSMKDSALLGPLTSLIRFSPYAIVGLALLPVGRGPARLLAAILLAIYGLVFGLLTQFSLYGLPLASAAFLLVSSDTWDRFLTKRDKRRVRTVIFDEDCGICFWIARYLRHLDTRRQLVFQGNSIADTADGNDQQLSTWDEDGKKLKAMRLPDGITPDLLEQTVVAVRPDGTFAIRGQAVVEVLRALPGFGLLGLILSLPIISSLLELAYKLFAPRRAAVSVELGMAACGVPQPIDKSESSAAEGEVAPIHKITNVMTGAFREVLVVATLAAFLMRADTVHNLGLGLKLAPEPKGVAGVLESVTWWTRTTSEWSLLTPEPPATTEGPAVDATIREGDATDTFAGGSPNLSLDRPFKLGSMWASYLPEIISDERRGYQSAFKSYLQKRGPSLPHQDGATRIVGVDFYWLKGPVDASSPLTEERVFRLGRGGARPSQVGGPGRNPTIPPRIPQLTPREEPPPPEDTPPPQRLTPGEELGE